MTREQANKAVAELKVSPLAHQLAKTAMDTIDANLSVPLFDHMPILQARECRRVLTVRLFEQFVTALAKEQSQAAT